MCAKSLAGEVRPKLGADPETQPASSREVFLLEEACSTTNPGLGSP